jgi:hypothetical protein
MKGVARKIDLINTFLSHNDRLNSITESALRFYDLKANPSPQLSLFLDFDLLIKR